LKKKKEVEGWKIEREKSERKDGEEKREGRRERRGKESGKVEGVVCVCLL
jgi:hypothetical protein